MFKKDKKIDLKPEIKSTTNLFKELLESSNFQSFNEENQCYYVNFNKYFDNLLKAKKLKRSLVFKRSNINERYAYQFFNGSRNITRDKAIMLAFGLGLNLEETQDLLKNASHLPLYPKVKRDTIIIISLSQRLSINDANELLYDQGEDILE